MDGTHSTTAGTSRGTYGVRVVGLGESAALGAVPADWPLWRVHVEQQRGDADHHAEFVGADEALIRFGDGSTAEVTRNGAGGTMRLNLVREVALDHVAHPYLAPVGMLSAYWNDRLPLHAGAFGFDGGAWLLVADKEGGKSTALATAYLAGHPVLTDDLSVISDDFAVHRGPRFIDLRRDAAEVLGVGHTIGEMGIRERWRFHIEDGPLTLPLAGIVIPSWGGTEIERVTGGECLEVLGPGLALRVPGRWAQLFMDVALSVPVLRWRRPRNLHGARSALDELLDVAGLLVEA